MSLAEQLWAFQREREQIDALRRSARAPYKRQPIFYIVIPGIISLSKLEQIKALWSLR